MRADVKAIWVAALTDGSYQQGRKSLRQGDSFCCLGVLCDLHAKETGEYWLFHDGTDFYKGRDTMPPEAVLDWADISSTEAAAYAGLNDAGRSFEEIARAIQATA